MKSAYPELPLIKNPKSTSVSLEESVHYLLGLTDECNARAVYSIMVAEASRTDDKKSFRSAIIVTRIELYLTTVFLN